MYGILKKYYGSDIPDNTFLRKFKKITEWIDWGFKALARDNFMEFKLK
jgi:hypothetical protein